jgi:hypothetical protein
LRFVAGTSDFDKRLLDYAKIDFGFYEERLDWSSTVHFAMSHIDDVRRQPSKLTKGKAQQFC